MLCKSILSWITKTLLPNMEYLWVVDLNMDLFVKWKQRYLKVKPYWFFLVCVCVRVFLRRLYQLYSHPSPEQVPCCWLLLNIMRCAICCSVIETVLSAMLQSISVQTFHEASQCVLTSCQLISEAAMVFFWLSHVLHVVGLVYCIPGEKFGFKYLSVFSTPSGACMLQGPYF